MNALVILQVWKLPETLSAVRALKQRDVCKSMRLIITDLSMKECLIFALIMEIR